jgi:RimJ/RimL family protein N-acetyltransferase
MIRQQSNYEANMSLAKTYRIETERLVIRCYEPGDARSLQDAVNASLDHLRPWMPWAREEPKGLGAKVELIRLFRGQFDLGQDYVFGIFLKGPVAAGSSAASPTGPSTATEVIGSTGLHTRLGKDAREIGYWISARYIGHGYATEVVSALMKVGFEIEGLNRIEIHCAPANLLSQRVPEKLGYRLEATLKKEAAQEVMIWTMTRKEYVDDAAARVGEAKVKAFDIGGKEIDFKAFQNTILPPHASK